VPRDLVPGEDSLERLGESLSAEDGDFSESSASVDGNQFSILNDNNTGTFTNSKRIFELGEDAVRVELAESQSIAVLGVYAIWVKYGEITILGARLEASTTLHKICAPATLALPQITARSQKADIVLTSTYDGLRDIQTDAKRTIWDIPGQTGSSRRSFQIAGPPAPSIRVVHLTDHLGGVFFSVRRGTSQASQNPRPRQMVVLDGHNLQVTS